MGRTNRTGSYKGREKCCICQVQTFIMIHVQFLNFSPFFFQQLQAKSRSICFRCLFHCCCSAVCHQCKGHPILGDGSTPAVRCVIQPQRMVTPQMRNINRSIIYSLISCILLTHCLEKGQKRGRTFQHGLKFDVKCLLLTTGRNIRSEKSGDESSIFFLFFYLCSRVEITEFV